PADEAARRLAGSVIRDRLLGALDLWLVADPDEGARAALRGLLRAADPDPYRDALRAAGVALDRRRIAGLAGQPGALAQPPRFAAAFGALPAVPTSRQRAVLEAALRSRPGDLTLLMELGEATGPRREDPTPPTERGTPHPLNQREVAEEVRWYQAAVAAHPWN